MILSHTITCICSSLMWLICLQIASERFREAVSFANFNSQLGGDCRIQLAICLDSTVSAALYQSICSITKA